MQYKVDLNERKNLIQRKIGKGGRALRVQLVAYRMLLAVMALGFVVLLVAALGNLIRCFLDGIRGVELFVMGAFVVCTPIPALIFSLLPLTVKRQAYRKYLRPWASYEQEGLTLYTKTFEQGYIDLFSGQGYLTNRMRYADIVRMEYDESQEILRVYGPFEVKEWSSINRERCYDTVPPDPSYDVWIDLIAYYEDFPKLMKELEERSGKKIIRKAGPCSLAGTKEDGSWRV